MFLRGWVPDSVVLEGMFLINTSPLVTHRTMKDYAQFTIRKFAVTHQVHIVFDSPGQNPHRPKTFETAVEMLNTQCHHNMTIFTSLIQQPYHRSHMTI